MLASCNGQFENGIPLFYLFKEFFIIQWFCILNTNNLKIDEPLDKKYVLSLQIKAIRNIRGFCLPTFCSRGERRDIENLIVGIFYNEKKRFKFYGTYRPVAIIQDTEKEEYIKVLCLKLTV